MDRLPLQVAHLGVWASGALALCGCTDEGAATRPTTASMDASTDARAAADARGALPEDAGGGVGGHDAREEPPAPTEVTCGSTLCTAPPLDASRLAIYLGDEQVPSFAATPLGTGDEGWLEPCCTADQGCGVQSAMFLPALGCVEQHQPGPVDEACPSLRVTLEILRVFSFDLAFAGCCREQDNLCGVDLDSVGAGCVARSEVGRIELLGVVDAGLQHAFACSPGEEDGGVALGEEDAGR